MEVIKKERQRTEYYEMFIANDGTEFDSREECEKYENSAEGVLMQRYKPLIVKETTEDYLFGWGSSDNTVEIVKPTSKDDADLIMQLVFLFNKYYREDKNKHYAERAQELIDRAVKESDVLVIERSYDMDGFWIVGTTASMKEEIDKFVKPVEKKED